MATRILGIPRLICLGMLGALLGAVAASLLNPLSLGPRSRLEPAAYCVSKIPGGTSLRLAMVHDVLNERYLRHGNAWYARRNADARQIMADEPPAPSTVPSEKYLSAMDDLAVGLEQIGQYDEAIALMQKKLALLGTSPDAPATRPDPIVHTTEHREFEIDQIDLQRIIAAQNLAPLQHNQYTALANLGTIILLRLLHNGLAADEATKARMSQSLGFIERSIAINPGGHFGREVWQAIAIEHLLAAIDQPDLLDEYDLIGDKLDNPTVRLSRAWTYSRGSGNLFSSDIPADQRLYIRGSIVRVGIDPAWAAAVHPDYVISMPFDEPTLAIVGMWTLGGGPNPHFALALGRIMENLGENYIAWDAYERAHEMSGTFWPDAQIRDHFAATCLNRQKSIAAVVAPADPAAWEAAMRSRHQSEMAWGLAYQRDYQNYEAAKIAAGTSPADADFYTAFFAGRSPIASSPGLSDDGYVTNIKPRNLLDALPCLVLGFGAGMVLGLVIPETRLS